jgi:hypothetical protein
MKLTVLISVFLLFSCHLIGDKKSKIKSVEDKDQSQSSSSPYSEAEVNNQASSVLEQLITDYNQTTQWDFKFIALITLENYISKMRLSWDKVPVEAKKLLDGFQSWKQKWKKPNKLSDKDFSYIYGENNKSLLNQNKLVFIPHLWNLKCEETIYLDILKQDSEIFKLVYYNWPMLAQWLQNHDKVFLPKYFTNWSNFLSPKIKNEAEMSKLRDFFKALSRIYYPLAGEDGQLITHRDNILDGILKKINGPTEKITELLKIKNLKRLVACAWDISFNSSDTLFRLLATERANWLAQAYLKHDKIGPVSWPLKQPKLNANNFIHSTHLDPWRLPYEIEVLSDEVVVRSNAHKYSNFTEEIIVRVKR